MFLHLGKNIIIHLEDVIAIMDLNSAARSEYTGEFISTAQEEGFVKTISSGKPKSMVITEKAVYFSPISSSTLGRRAGFMNGISDF
jgi:hypothetical protein